MISGDYATVEYFVTKYPATRRQTNKAGSTALQIAQKLKFTRIAQLIETGKPVPEIVKDDENKPKHDFETLAKASRDGSIKIIQEFIAQRYESKEEKRKICYRLIQIAKEAKQDQIVHTLQQYHDAKLKTELASDMEQGGSVALSEHYKKVLLGFLSGLSSLIANSPDVLDPTNPQTYIDLFSCLTKNIEKRSLESRKVVNEHDVQKLVEQDQANTKEQLTKINEQLEQLMESKNSLQVRMQDNEQLLFEQKDITALQRKEIIKEKELHKQQLAAYECSIFLFQRQQEATLIRQNTINFIKGNANLIMFYRTIENRLQALFHSALAAQGGYLKTETTNKYAKSTTVLNQIPISKSIFAV